MRRECWGWCGRSVGGGEEGVWGVVRRECGGW